MFLAYKGLLEKQSSYQVLKLRYDNRGEYLNNKFTTFCNERGIQMHYIIMYTPQQNGVATRKNCTLK